MTHKHTYTHHTSQEPLQAKVDDMYEEYEELETLLAQFPDVKR